MEEDERGEVAMDAETGGRGDAESSAPGTQTPELEPAPDPQAELERLRGELEGARVRWLESHRRALLAENAGRVVPELVQGGTIEALEASVEVARGAFEAAKAAALAELASARVPAGNPVRQSPNVETMSPIEKIAFGLKRSNE